MRGSVTIRDGNTDLVLSGDDWEANPYFIAPDFNLGFPTIREVVQDSPDMDGTLDYTTLFGSRSISGRVIVRAAGTSINQRLDALLAALAPYKRVTVIIEREGWSTPRQIDARVGQYSCLITKSSHVYAEALISLVGPDGAFTSSEDLYTEVSPLFGTDALDVPRGAVGSAAWTVPSGDTTDPALVVLSGTGDNVGLVVNDGTLPVWPVFLIYGPCTNAGITLWSTSFRLVFESGFVIPAGQVVEINTRTRKATMAGNTVYHKIDFGRSRWFQIPVGESNIQFDADNTDSGCKLVVQATRRYI